MRNEKRFNRLWKRPLPVGAIILVVLAMIVAHVGGGISLFHAVQPRAFSLENPVSYIIIGLFLALVALKVFVGHKLIRGLRSKRRGEKP